MCKPHLHWKLHSQLKFTVHFVKGIPTFVDNCICSMILHAKVGSKPLDQEGSIQKVQIVDET